MDFKHNGVTYHLHLWGNSQNPPILLLHGFTGSGLTWQDIAQRFASSYYVCAPDLLGHGKTSVPSDPSRYTFAQLRDDLCQLAKAVFGARPFHLLGYSMGGRIALDFALAHTNLLKTLILESASDGIADDQEREARRQSDDALAERIIARGIAAFVAEWEALPLWHTQSKLPDNIRQQQRDQRLQNNPIGLANSLRGHGTGVQTSHRNRLHQLRLPVLLLSGAQDTKFVAIAESMCQHMPHARHVVLLDVGHAAHLENPEAFSNTVLEFLKEWH